MIAKLVVQDGVDAGRLYILQEEKVTAFGRDTVNEVQLLHESISRQHARIFARDGQFFLLDLNSANGTYVNDERIEERVLADGDRIRIGAVQLRFMQAVRPSRSSARLTAVDEDLHEGSQMFDRNALAQPNFLNLDGREKSVETYERAHHELATIYKVTNAFLAEQEEDSIYDILVHVMQDVLNPDSVFVLVGEGSADDLKVIRKGGKLQHEATLSRSVVRKAVQEGLSILSTDVSGDTRFKDGSSSVFSGIRSVLCVPLESHKRILGVIYADTHSITRRFEKNDLELISAIGRQAGLTVERLRMVREFEELFLGTVRTLVAAIEAKDRYTFGHSERVTKYSLEIGRALSLSKEDLDRLEISALLHDIGKIGVPENILNKPTGLSEQERFFIRQHPVLGATIIRNIKNIGQICEGVQHHHEYWDGSGYPEGLKEMEIPFFSRILSVADSYDAMTSDRVYRRGLTREQALDEIERCSGMQFDPNIVKSFVAIRRQKLKTEEIEMTRKRGDKGSSSPSGTLVRRPTAH